VGTITGGGAIAGIATLVFGGSANGSGADLDTSLILDSLIEEQITRDSMIEVTIERDSAIETTLTRESTLVQAS
jgi:hypothetical protein